MKVYYAVRDLGYIQGNRSLIDIPNKDSLIIDLVATVETPVVGDVTIIAGLRFNQTKMSVGECNIKSGGDSQFILKVRCYSIIYM